MVNNKGTRCPVNDINQCIERARTLAKASHTRQPQNRSYHRIFVSLTGDEEIGWLAFAIWKGRSDLLSRIRRGLNHPAAA
jgi:hypothetical protein